MQRIYYLIAGILILAIISCGTTTNNIYKDRKADKVVKTGIFLSGKDADEIKEKLNQLILSETDLPKLKRGYYGIDFDREICESWDEKDGKFGRTKFFSIRTGKFLSGKSYNKIKILIDEIVKKRIEKYHFGVQKNREISMAIWVK